MKGSHSMTPAERIRARTVIDPATGCWNWTGYVDHAGYATITYKYKVSHASRLSYEAFVGPISEGMDVDHLCRNPACCNPDHLEAVTRMENVRRARLIGYDHPNAPKTCRRGHDPGELRVRTRRNGKTVQDCLACKRERWRRANPVFPSEP